MMSRTAPHLLCALVIAGAGAELLPVVAAAPQYTFAGPPAAEAAEPAGSPYAIVRDRIARLETFLGAQPERDPAAIRDFLERRVAPYFDFAAMSQWAAGPFYPSLTAEQRDALARKIRGMFLDSLARNLGAYAADMPEIRVFPSRAPEWATQEVVRAQVRPPEAYPIILDFRFFLGPDGWRIFDVAANGFSAASYYRHLFAGRVRAAGPEALYR